MKLGKRARVMLAAAPFLLGVFLAGCGDFWQAPGGGTSTSFTLSNSGNLVVAPGATTGNTATITVTPANSFTGTVTLSCAVADSLSNPTSPTTCSLDQTSISITSTTPGTATLTAATTSTTTTGAYQLTVTGVSGSISETTTVCVEVTTGSGACSSTATTSGNFYILNSGSISGYNINSSVLTPLTGSPTTLTAVIKDDAPTSMAIDPSGQFLYVGTNTGGIFLYDIGSGGALTLASPDSVISVPFVQAMQVDSTGNWLLVAANPGGEPVLYAYPISTSNGGSVLTASAPPSEALVSGGNVSPGGIAISPDNNLVAVAAGLATQTFPFTAGTDFSGATNPLAGTAYKTNAKGTAISVVFGPQTSYLYIGETGVYSNGGGLRILPIASDVPGNEPSFSSSYPYPSGGTSPHAILATTAGYVYVANWVGSGSGNITAFQLNTSGPTLTVQTSPATTGTEPYSMVEDSSGSYVLAVSFQGSPSFNAYTFDAATAGKLDPALNNSNITQPIAIVAVP